MATIQHPPTGWPPILYGTAWKGENTAELTRRAIISGYRAVDTAGQPRHYYEPGVGSGVAEALQELGLGRAELFLQTKFSPLMAQGSEIPYDRHASPAEQVEQSLQSSLVNLGTDCLDSYLLHGPQGGRVLGDADWAVWRALEAAQDSGRVSRIGISNVGVRHLEELVEHARIPPAAVQNRCFARDGWDRDVRGFCAQHGIAYQGFSLLTANPQVLQAPSVREMASSLGTTPAQVVFAFARGAGMIPLTGTTSESHMTDDLAALDIELDSEDLSALERIESG